MLRLSAKSSFPDRAGGGPNLLLFTTASFIHSPDNYQEAPVCWTPHWALSTSKWKRLSKDKVTWQASHCHRITSGTRRRDSSPWLKDQRRFHKEVMFVLDSAIVCLEKEKEGRTLKLKNISAWKCRGNMRRIWWYKVGSDTYTHAYIIHCLLYTKHWAKCICMHYLI